MDWGSFDLMNKNIFNERFIISSENRSFQEVFAYISEDFNIKPPAIYASPFITGLAWRMEKIKSAFLNKVPFITKESVKSAHSISNYSNKKITDLLSYEFLSIEESIKENCKNFLNDWDN